VLPVVVIVLFAGAGVVGLVTFLRSRSRYGPE
jgi:hypothetical protein